MFDDLFAMRWGGTMTSRIDPATRNASRAKFLQMFPAAELTTHNPESTLRVESEDNMLSHTVHAKGREWTIEFHGPYDLNTWNYVDINLNDDEEATIVGSGKTYRLALENAVRNTLRTPYEEFRPVLERESQLYLESLAGSDEIQSQDLYKIWCVLKVKK